MSYTLDSARSNSNKNALDFLASSDKINCPITSCALKEKDCVGSYKGSIALSTKAPFEISGNSNQEKGWSEDVCLVCTNKDETKQYAIEVKQ